MRPKKNQFCGGGGQKKNNINNETKWQENMSASSTAPQFKRWTHTEEHHMLSLLNQGKTIDTVATQLGRSHKAVLLRLGGIMCRQSNHTSFFDMNSFPMIPRELQDKARQMFDEQEKSKPPTQSRHDPHLDEKRHEEIMTMLHKIRKEIRHVREQYESSVKR